MHKALGICDNAAGIPSWSELHCPGTRLRLPILVRCRLIVWSVYEAEPVSGQEHHSRRSRRPSLWIRYCRDLRHDSLRVMAILYLISGLGCAAAWSWPSLVGCRFLGGLGIGGSSVLGPMYIAEIAPARLRGRLV